MSVVRTALRIAAIVTLGLNDGAIAAPDAPPTTLIVGPDQIVTGSIGGTPVRYLMTPSGPGTLVLNPDTVARLAIKSGMIGGSGKIGPVRIPLKTAVIDYAVGAQSWKRRIIWFDRPFAIGFDGAISPNAVPQDVVILDLRAPVAGEAECTMPLTVSERGFGTVGTTVRIGTEDVFVTWDLTQTETFATAAAANDLAGANGGQLTGATTTAVIRLNVERPVRHLKLTTPLLLGPLRIETLLARVSDYGNTANIADADAPVDDSEIIVTAKGGKTKPLRDIRIGRDALRRCSQIRFDKPKKLITLTCQPT